MKNLNSLCIEYEKLVNNLSKQGVDINNLSGLLHKMEHTGYDYDKLHFSGEINQMLISIANNDLESGNKDLEMYLSWLEYDEFSGNKKR